MNVSTVQATIAMPLHSVQILILVMSARVLKVTGTGIRQILEQIAKYNANLMVGLFVRMVDHVQMEQKTMSRRVTAQPGSLENDAKLQCI